MYIATIGNPGNSYEDQKARESIEKVAQSRQQVGGQEEGLAAIHITQFSLSDEKILLKAQVDLSDIHTTYHCRTGKYLQSSIE